jgi:hypothetical protein
MRRRVERENEHYLYEGQNEIGAFISYGEHKSLRVFRNQETQK